MSVKTNSSWNEQPDFWRCPSCTRIKKFAGKISKKGDKIFYLFRHHDHMSDYANESLISQYDGLDEVIKCMPQFLEGINIMIKSFRDTLVCQRCNELDTQLKKLTGADKFFSYSPAQIQSCIDWDKLGGDIMDLQLSASSVDTMREIYIDEISRDVAFRKELIKNAITRGKEYELISLYSCMQ